MQQNMKKWLRCAVALAAAGVLGLASLPVAATDAKPIEPRTAAESQTENIDDTFEVVSESDESAVVNVGKNIFLTGNTLSDDSKTDDLVLAAGNSLNLGTSSEYSFIAGNVIKFGGETTKDIFVAGNMITLDDEAKIGRDAFVAGNSIALTTDLKGSLSAAGNIVTLDNVTIAGNLNLSASRIVFKGDVKVAGKVVYNDDAEVSGLDNLTYGSLETYEDEEAEVSLVMIWYAKLMSVISLFVVMIAVLAIWKHTPAKVAQVDDATKVARRLVAGLGALLLVPILALLAIMSYVLAPVGLVLILAYIIMIYVAQGFAGLWLGHLLLSKAFKLRSNAFVEAFVGILVLGVCALIPYLGILTGFFGLLLGLGLIVDCVKKDNASKAETPKDAKTLKAADDKSAKNAKKDGDKKVED